MQINFRERLKERVNYQVGTISFKWANFNVARILGLFKTRGPGL